MIKKMDSKTFNKLKELEPHLTRGYYGKYVYALRRPEFDKMYKVYKDLGGERSLDYSCNSCVLQLVTKLGEMYFKYKEAQEEKEKNKK